MVLTFSLTCCSVAQAQIQPVYTRPSKGKPVDALTNVTASTQSAIYDWSAFDGAYILVRSPGVCTFRLYTDGYTSSTGSADSAATIYDPNAEYLAGLNNSSNTFYISIPTPFIKFRVSINTLPSPACPGGLYVNVTPVPFTQRMISTGGYPDGSALSASSSVYPVLIGGVRKGSPGNPVISAMRVTNGGGVLTLPQTSTTGIASSAVTVTNAATIVEASSPSVCYRKFINTDTTIAYCGTTSAVTASNGYPLSAAGGAGQAGGTLEIPGYNGDFYCITSAGTTTVRTISYSCPP
jgi:hypothetical protein